MAPSSRLAPCPRSPNCVSTRADDPRQRMEPIPFQGTPETARETLLAVLGERPRTEIVAAEECYLHAVERSALLRFADDVELEIDAESGQIHFRSASRLGYSDLGANRRRMEEIRRRFLQRQEAGAAGGEP